MVTTSKRLRLQRVLGVTTAKKKNGGRREGAGRKPIGDEAKLKFATRFSKEVIDFLNETSVGITKTDLVERILRDSIEFRTWQIERQT